MLILPVYKNSIPYEAKYTFAGSTFLLRFQYNAVGDFFTVDLVKRGETLIAAEKIVFGKALFTSYPADDRLPFPAIIPVDLALLADRAGWREMGEYVHLYVPTLENLEAMFQ